MPTEEAIGPVAAMAEVHRRRPWSKRVLNLLMDGDVFVPFAVLLTRRSARVDNICLQHHARPSKILALCGSKKSGVLSDSHRQPPIDRYNRICFSRLDQKS